MSFIYKVMLVGGVGVKCG